MAEQIRQVGWREVVVLATAVVAVVLGAAVVTSLLPTQVQQWIFHGPVLIIILIVATGWLLWRIGRPGPDVDDRS